MAAAPPLPSGRAVGPRAGGAGGPRGAGWMGSRGMWRGRWGVLGVAAGSAPRAPGRRPARPRGSQGESRAAVLPLPCGSRDRRG